MNSQLSCKQSISINHMILTYIDKKSVCYISLVHDKWVVGKKSKKKQTKPFKRKIRITISWHISSLIWNMKSHIPSKMDDVSVDQNISLCLLYHWSCYINQHLHFLIFFSLDKSEESKLTGVQMCNYIKKIKLTESFALTNINRCFLNITLEF